MKPRIILLLLITSIGGAFLAASGPPPIITMTVILLGGTLTAGGANAINHYMDRDIDKIMLRTQGRPIPSNRIRPLSAMTYGILLNGAGFLVLAVGANILSASLAVGASVFYILIYTKWLKRSTPQNIVIGGAAGAIPPLVAWAAITGSISLPAVYLFLIILLWTPPHFWALSLLLKDDYARANVPMLPVVKGERHTSKAILIYTLVLVASTILLYTSGGLGFIYLTTAVILGILFILEATRLFFKITHYRTRRLFQFSLLYLALLFVAIIVDTSLTL
jgi:protoheme IX farnesyltransferase